MPHIVTKTAASKPVEAEKDAPAFVESVDRAGYAIVPAVLTEEEVEDLLADITQAVSSDAAIRGKGGHGVRNLFDRVPAVCALAASPAMRRLAEPALGIGCFAVRAILFDKVEGANWKVPWHQDVSVAVRERRDVEGYGAWSEKAGVVHAHAPAALLETMLTLRLHLDDCDETNGPLHVLPGTHLRGKLNDAQIQRLRADTPPKIGVVPRGGVLLMRPLLLHASYPAQTPRHRRVIHLEYAAGPLPRGLAWQSQVNQCKLLQVGSKADDESRTE